VVWSTEKETPLWLPYIASLHYINTPKLALAHQEELARSCLNKKGAAHHCPSSVWIWRKTINPLMSYIKPQITPPSPLKVAAQNGGSQRRVKKFGGFWITTWKTRQKYSPFDLAGGGGGCMHEVWFGSFSQRL
jgi:hypothetical protein